MKMWKYLFIGLLVFNGWQFMHPNLVPMYIFCSEFSNRLQCFSTPVSVSEGNQAISEASRAPVVENVKRFLIPINTNTVFVISKGFQR